MLISDNSNQKAIVYDIIVIGGGFAGAFTALELIKKGYRVLHIDKDSSILGESSSSFNECYKLHTGLHYLGDLETAIQCLLGSIEFAKEFPQFIEGKHSQPHRKGRHYIMSNSLYDHVEVCEALQKIYAQKVEEDEDNAVFGDPKDFIKYLKREDYPYVAEKIPYTDEGYTIDAMYEIIPEDNDVKSRKIYIYLEHDQIYCKAVNKEGKIEKVNIGDNEAIKELESIKSILRSGGIKELTPEHKKFIFDCTSKHNPLFSETGTTENIYVKTAIETPESQINIKKLRAHLQEEFKKYPNHYTFLPNHEVKHLSFDEGTLNYNVETHSRKYNRIVMINSWPVENPNDSHIYCIKTGNSAKFIFLNEKNWEEKNFTLDETWPKEITSALENSELSDGHLIDKVTLLCGTPKNHVTESYTSAGVANCAWHKIEELDRQLGYVANDETTTVLSDGKKQTIKSERIIRPKISLLVQLPDSLKNVNTAIFSCGPHMSFTNLGDGTAVITYEPVTNAGAYPAGTVILPEEIRDLYKEKLVPDHGKGKEFAERIIAGCGGYLFDLVNYNRILMCTAFPASPDQKTVYMVKNSNGLICHFWSDNEWHHKQFDCHESWAQEIHNASENDEFINPNLMRKITSFYGLTLANCKTQEVRLGHVKMFVKNGKTFSLNDKNSAIHGRQEDGVETKGLCYVSHSGMKMTYTKKGAEKVAKMFKAHFYKREKLLERGKKMLKAPKKVISILRDHFYTKDELAAFESKNLEQEIVEAKDNKINKFYNMILYNIFRDLTVETTEKICEKNFSSTQEKSDESEAQFEEKIDKSTKESIIDGVVRKSSVVKEVNNILGELDGKSLNSLLSKVGGKDTPPPPRKFLSVKSA